MAALYRGDGVAAERLAGQAVTEADELSSPIVSGAAHMGCAEVELALGRYDDLKRRVRDHILPHENWRPPAWAFLGAAAVAQRDVEALRQSVEARREFQDRGRLAAGATGTQAGMLDVIEGRAADGIARFREAIRILRDIEVPSFVGAALLGMVQALGPDAPETATFAAEARAIYETMGARHHLDRLEEALGRPVASTQPKDAAEARVSG
jgi:hypothetical protein